MKLGDKVILFGFIDGCSYETTGQTNFIIALETGERVEIPFGGAINVDKIVFKDNIKLKDVIKRIKGFDDETKFKWTYDILKELGSDFCSKMFHEAYQQGKFEGEWVGQQLKDADKIRQELNKPVIPQEIANEIEYYKKNDGYDLFSAMDSCYNKHDDWLECNQETFARAWLDGYEVEKEKRYRISMPKARNHKNHAQILCEMDGSIFWCGEWYPFRTKLTRKELENADFGWVFDCPGIEIEEVE